MRGFGLRLVWIMVASVGVAMATFSVPVQASGKAGLRILCDGQVENSRVTINGKRMGNCPVDLEVPAGLIHLVISRNTFNPLLERRYETRFELAPNALRRVLVENDMLDLVSKNQARSAVLVWCESVEKLDGSTIFVGGIRVGVCNKSVSLTTVLDVLPGTRQIRAVNEMGPVTYVFSEPVTVAAGEITHFPLSGPQILN